MAFLSACKNTLFLWLLILSACGNPINKENSSEGKEIGELARTAQLPIVTAANRTLEFLPLLKEKKVAVVANQTSVIFKESMFDGQKLPYTHLVDSLLALGVTIDKVFAPEHGFRGRADAGEKVKDGIDTQTGLPIISLYGKNRKPTPEQLQGIDIVVFDIQDVGVRFYTYIATLQLVMEACAAAEIPVLVLDRPNPNGHYVDGPSMQTAHTSFLGMTEIPLVYGMTIGEYARMLNGEGWLEAQLKAQLTVIPLENYTHKIPYSLQIRPSPNLPSDTAINLYPSLGLFEGTNVNAGRGTEYQFQRYGAPFLDSTKYDFSYTPKPNFGSKHPKQQDAVCYGKDLSAGPEMNMVSLKWLLDAFKNTTDKTLFFNTEGFTKHAGTAKLQQQIEAGLSEAEIKKSWKADLEAFRAIRKKYLLYPD